MAHQGLKCGPRRSFNKVNLGMFFSLVLADIQHVSVPDHSKYRHWLGNKTIEHCLMSSFGSRDDKPSSRDIEITRTITLAMENNSFSNQSFYLLWPDKKYPMSCVYTPFQIPPMYTTRMTPYYALCGSWTKLSLTPLL